MCSMVRADLVPGDHRDASVWFRLHLQPRRSRDLWGDGELQHRIWPLPQLQRPSRVKYVDLHYETCGNGVIEEVPLPEGCVSRDPVVFLGHRGDHGPEQGALQD